MSVKIRQRMHILKKASTRTRSAIVPQNQLADAAVKAAGKEECK